MEIYKMIKYQIYKETLLEISEGINSFISNPVRVENPLSSKTGYSNKYIWPKITHISVIRTESNRFSAVIDYEETFSPNSNN